MAELIITVARTNNPNSDAIQVNLSAYTQHAPHCLWEINLAELLRP